MEDNPTLFAKLKFVNEKATLFRITTNAMISVSETRQFFQVQKFISLNVFLGGWRKDAL